MIPVEYLLTGFLSVMALGSWILVNALRQATDGYEDELGFHLGATPPISSLYPALAQSTYAPAEIARAVVPPERKRRRKSGSKPPMLPANLQVDDLNPRQTKPSQPATDPAKAKTGKAGETQIPFPFDPPATP